MLSSGLHTCRGLTPILQLLPNQLVDSVHKSCETESAIAIHAELRSSLSDVQSLPNIAFRMVFQRNEVNLPIIFLIRTAGANTPSLSTETKALNFDKELKFPTPQRMKRH